MNLIRSVVTALIVCAASSAAHAESPAAGNFSYSSEEGAIFAQVLKVLNPTAENVARDFAVAFQVKCGRSIGTAELRTLLNGKDGQTAIELLQKDERTNNNLKNYMALVTSVECS